MLSKNFIFIALFFGVILLCLSCLENENKNQYKDFYTTFPTDSSDFSASLEAIEIIKTSHFDLEGQWKLVNKKSEQNKDTLYYLFFRERKVYSRLYPDNLREKGNSENLPSFFAIYNKCPRENGVYDKQGNFLVIGSGKEKLICYQILSYTKNRMIIYDSEKNNELEFVKI